MMPVVVPPEPGDTVEFVMVQIGDDWTKFTFSRPVPRAEAMQRAREVLESLASPPAKPADSGEIGGLIERLRGYRSYIEWGDPCQHSICDEAADTLARLEAELAAALHDLTRYMDIANSECRRAESLEAERRGLREALGACVKVIEGFNAESIGGGVHAGLRKGTDAADAQMIYDAIARSRTTAWSDACAFAVDPHFTMWGGNKALELARAALSPSAGGER